MVTSFALLFLSIAIIESMAGILGNGIILAASSSSCIGSKTWSPYDMIMICLSLCRIILQSWTILVSVLFIFSEHFFVEENLLVIIKAACMFLTYSSHWFGAWLSVFYCIKIASFARSFFIWLKQKIARLVPWMLLTSLLCSFRTTIPFAWGVYGVHNNLTASFHTTNPSVMRTIRKDSLTLLILLCNAGISLPLILSVVSSLLLIQSLCIHTRHMQNNASGFRDPSLEAHMKAIKSVCSFLILYIIYFIAFIFLLSNILSTSSKTYMYCCNGCLSCSTLDGLNLEQSKISRAASQNLAPQ